MIILLLYYYRRLFNVQLIYKYFYIVMKGLGGGYFFLKIFLETQNTSKASMKGMSVICNHNLLFIMNDMNHQKA